MKKFLSLVLAVVMTFSLVTISAGAKDFTDNSKITYKEAVDVVSACKIIDGYTDGSFNPQNTLTRGAAAKIICNLILGPTTAGALATTTAPFSDVAANSTFAGYIAYCSSQGIISGYADGKFYPARSLTGYAFTKMLLGALGYDSAIEGYTGSNWAVNVAKQAKADGLTDGNANYVGSNAVTREEACLYAYNTLNATMVEYTDKGTSITINGATITSGASKASDVKNTSKTDGNIDNDDLMQFAEKYFSDLTKNDDSNDLKQPAEKWKLKSETIGSYASSADKTIVVKDSGKTLYDILTGSSYGDYSSSDVLAKTTGDNAHAVTLAYVNGEVKTNEADTVVTDVINDLKAVNMTKGDVVYTYENDDGDLKTVVVARYTYASVDSVATNMSTTEKDNGAAYRLKLVDFDGNNIATYYDSYDDTDKYELPGFVSDTYEEDAVLAVAFKADGKTIVDSYVAKVVSGQPTSVKAAANGNITVSGTKYNYAGTPAGNYNNIDFDKTYKVYTTTDGYVIAIDGASTANLTDLYYVTGVYKETSGGEATYYAQRVAVDGTVSTVKVELGALQTIDKGNKTTNLTGTLDSETSKAWAGLYTFSDKKVAAGTGIEKQKAGDEVYTIKVASTDADVTDDFTIINGTASTDLKSSDTTLSYTAGTTKKAYLNSETKYLTVESLGSKIDTSTATGGMKVDAVNGTVIVVTDESDGKTAKLVIFAANSITSSASTEDIVYLAGDTAQKTSSDTYSTDDLWFMKDTTNPAGTIITDDIHTGVGFYTYSMSGSNYKLEDDTTPLSIASGKSYDDEEGYVESMVVTDVYKTTHVSFADVGGAHFADVKFNGVTVIDTRSDSDIDSSVYDTEITTVSDLKDAAKLAPVTVDVYFDAGVKFVAVTAVGTGYALTVPATVTAGTTTTATGITSLDKIAGGTTVYFKVVNNALKAAPTVAGATVTLVSGTALAVGAVYSFTMPAAAAEIVATVADA